MKAFFNEPFCPFGKWLSQSSYVHTLTFFLLLSAVTFHPVFDYWEGRQRLNVVETELSEKRETLLHQKKILASLQQSESHKLSPELGAKIMPLNKQIQRLAARNGLALNLRWEMGPQPLLHLQLTGHFIKTKAFLTALLTHSPQLSVGRLQFNKSEDSPLQTEIIFLLEKETK